MKHIGTLLGLAGALAAASAEAEAPVAPGRTPDVVLDRASSDTPVRAAPAMAAPAPDVASGTPGAAPWPSTPEPTGKLRVSGFVAGRYEWHADSVNGWDEASNSAASATKSTFLIRNARLDTSYAGTNAELIVQLDAGGDAVALRDAEAAFVDTWTPLHLRISVGQFKYPFGYELRQSIPAREMPERSRMIRQLFPGERDRGLKVEGRYRDLRVQAALVNGNGAQDPIFKSGRDSNAWLDVVGRVGVDFTTIAGGLSWYYGGSDVYNPTSSTSSDPAKLMRFARLRLGGDAQSSLEVPRLGTLVLRGELVYSRDKNLAYNGVAANACQDRVGLGWSVVAAQNLGPIVAAVVRVDSFDPLLRSSLASTCVSSDGSTGTYLTAGSDRVITYGGGLLAFVSQNLKATFTYEHPTEQDANKKDNDIVTAQLLARF